MSDKFQFLTIPEVSELLEKASKGVDDCRATIAECNATLIALEAEQRRERRQREQQDQSVLMFVADWIKKNKPTDGWQDNAILLVSESLYHAYVNSLKENVRFMPIGATDYAVPSPVERVRYRKFCVTPVGLTAGEPWTVYGAYVKASSE